MAEKREVLSELGAMRPKLLAKRLKQMASSSSNANDVDTPTPASCAIDSEAGATSSLGHAGVPAPVMHVMPVSSAASPSPPSPTVIHKLTWLRSELNRAEADALVATMKSGEFVIIDSSTRVGYTLVVQDHGFVQNLPIDIVETSPSRDESWERGMYRFGNKNYRSLVELVEDFGASGTKHLRSKSTPRKSLALVVDPTEQPEPTPTSTLRLQRSRWVRMSLTSSCIDPTSVVPANTAIRKMSSRGVPLGIFTSYSSVCSDGDRTATSTPPARPAEFSQDQRAHPQFRSMASSDVARGADEARVDAPMGQIPSYTNAEQDQNIPAAPAATAAQTQMMKMAAVANQYVSNAIDFSSRNAEQDRKMPAATATTAATATQGQMINIAAVANQYVFAMKRPLPCRVPADQKTAIAATAASGQPRDRTARWVT